MLLKITIILMLFVGQVAVHACMGPENVFGIQLNNGESIDVSVIENFGEKDVNYYKKEQNGLLTYSFRSHYNQSIMVEVITHTDPAVVSGALNFTVDTSTLKMTEFPYGACVRAELDWLVTAGVLEMERIKRERIEQSFKNEAQQEHPAASFFWTKQDSLIPNNAIFTSTKNGEVIVAQANCGGLAFAATDLPPEKLDIAVGIAAKNTKRFSRGHIVTAPDRSATLVVDIHGRMHRLQGPAGLKSQRSGLLLSFDRRSGTVKRVVTLP